MTANLPSDATTLLVPIHLDAWVVSAKNQELVSWFPADYDHLSGFDSPVPAPFQTVADQPAVGVHLHWALPDALTHGRQTEDGSIDFPLVPNRWAVLRFNSPTDGAWAYKAWVVESDRLHPPLGTTKSGLSGDVTSIPLAAGATAAIAAGTVLHLAPPLGSPAKTAKAFRITTAQAVAQGDTQVPIESQDLGAAAVPAGSRLYTSPTSYIDPTGKTFVDVDPTSKTYGVQVQSARLGAAYTIDGWEGLAETAGGDLFLRAVGPANVAFAAYAPFAGNVFSFVDTDLPPEGTGVFKYTYLVVGWYSDSSADPLHGKANYDGGWTKVEAAAGQPASIVMQALRWTAPGQPATPPSQSLYHALVTGVVWPTTTLADAGVDLTNVRVAVGDSTVAALAALIRSESQAGQSAATAPLLEAALLDQLDRFGRPGGAAEVEERLHRAWFGSVPGGLVWEVVGSSQAAAGAPSPAQQAAIDQQLAQLNQDQRAFDEAKRQLESLQTDLYALWWALGKIQTGWDPSEKDQIETNYTNLKTKVWNQLWQVQQLAAKLPEATDAKTATAWGDQQWKTLLKTSLSALGLELKGAPGPRFWHPTDPVVLISGLGRSKKHGADGSYRADGNLPCRLEGQTITGLNKDGRPLQASGAGLDQLTAVSKQLSTCKQIPGLITRLVREAFFADPANAQLISVSTADIQGLLEGATSSSLRWAGTPPAPFATSQWQQAWSPLFLEWQASYYPTGAGTGGDRCFSMNDWQLTDQYPQADGSVQPGPWAYRWQGTGFDQSVCFPYVGRAILTPGAPTVMKSRISKFLADHPHVDTADLKQLISGWDLLSQSLSGFTDQLLTLESRATFPPAMPDGAPAKLSPPSPGSAAPSISTLIGEQFHLVPKLVDERDNRFGDQPSLFHSVRAGFLQLTHLRIVDAFGQTVELVAPNTPQGFQPIVARGLQPSGTPPFTGAIQLPPRLVQASRLDFRLLANDGSGDTVVTGKPAVCGWLLPNHVDGGLAVYDDQGRALGELVAGAQGLANWRPRPGSPARGPQPATPDAIANPTLQSVVKSLADQSSKVLQDALRAIDEALWMVDPLGGRKDQLLSVLVGRPLAVVQTELALRLCGQPAASRLLSNLAPPDFGGLEKITFPVRLGSLELRDDGLLGYFLPTESAGTFHVVHLPEGVSQGDGYLKKIGAGGDFLQLRYLQDAKGKPGAAVRVVLLLDPRGSVHASSGILPTTEVALPAHTVEGFLRQLEVSFRVGPLIDAAGAPRLPAPAEHRGTWSWVQRTSGSWEENAIADAEDRGSQPPGGLQLRDGWLRLAISQPES